MQVNSEGKSKIHSCFDIFRFDQETVPKFVYFSSLFFCSSLFSLAFSSELLHKFALLFQEVMFFVDLRNSPTSLFSIIACMFVAYFCS